MPEPEPASAASVAGLASELETLKRRVEPLHRIPGRLEQLAERIEAFGAELAAANDRGDTGPMVSWLAAPDDAEVVRDRLAGLVGWLDAVFLRYPDAAGVLPDCWAWHPHVIEELLWCQHAWHAAYTGNQASPTAVGDWHDRYRPGVVRRLAESVGMCSLETHQHPTPPPGTPVPGAVEPIVAWWTEHRHQPAPAPTEQHHAAAAARREPDPHQRR